MLDALLLLVAQNEKAKLRWSGCSDYTDFLAGFSVNHGDNHAISFI